ncbi:MAG: peptidoglycan-binding domain-containing protein [Candidatus Zambryskibacteria bacterium]|nr:peptidoglycan-binding domain-containing protein [Candidatus Zambryskibacteria bacterium]
MSLTKSRTAKFVAGIAGFALALSFVVTPVTTSAATIAELQAMIASLSAQLAALSGTPATTGSYTFNTNLTLGSTGTDVMNLQKVLNSSADTQVAATGVGSPGSESSYFGGLTKAAVMKFQTKYGITPVAGYVGAITRAKLNTMGGTTGGTTVVPGLPTGGNLVVTAGVQPVNSLAPQSAARVPFTTLTLTAGSADVTVNSITVQRVGLGVDTVFSGVVLVDSNNLQIGTSKTFNSNHQANVGEPFVIKAGTSKTVTVSGNMLTTALTAYAGQVIGLNVVAVNTSATVTGSLPISGAQQTINASLSIGSVSTSTSAFDPGTTQTKNIGDTSVRVTGIKFTANSVEDLRLYSVRWRQTGTASSADISNVVTKVDSTAYPTTVSADGKYYTSVFPNGILIPKGNSIDVYTEIDITGSNSNLRTVELDIDKVTDVYLVGQTFGYGIMGLYPTASPWQRGYVTTINAGTVTTISKANEVVAQNIASNVNNQVLGGFATNFSGEPVSITGMVFTLSTTSATIGTGSAVVTSVSLVDSTGTVVAGPVDATVSGSGLTQTVTFTDSITFPVGRKVYTLKGKIPSTAVNGAVLTAATTPSGWSSPTGQVSGATVSISTGAVTMNSMTVKGAALAINISAQPASQSVVGGITGFVLANYQLDASQSGEDVRLNAFPVKVTSSVPGDLTGCTLNDGSTPLNTGSRTINTLSATGVKTPITFDNSLIVPKGTVKTGNTVVPTYGLANGGTMTPGNGSLTASIDSSSPAYTIVAGGATGQTTTVIKLRASNENVNLNKIGLILTAVTTGNSRNVAGNLTGVNLYNGSTLIGTALFASGATVATSTLNSPLLLTKDTDVYITVKADIADVSQSGSATEGDKVVIDLDSTEGSGVSSGATIRTGAQIGAAGIRVFNTFPVIAQGSLTTAGIADGKLLRFAITADSHGDVGIYKFTFTLSTSTTLTLGDIGLYGYTDTGYTTPMSGNFAAGATSAGGLVDSTLATSTTISKCDINGATNVTAAGSKCLATASLTTLTIKAATNPVTIPAGATRYFELRAATVTGGAVTTSSVLTKMSADASTDFATSTASGSSGLFVWSPNATTTSVFSANDWTVGYGIVGFPSQGLLQNRSY